MANFNRVILAGNLTRDPQLKYLPSNTAVCEFGLAINHRWRDRDGNQREDTCFVDVSAFGRQGETINQYMTKGRSILIEGRLKFDSWTGQDGQKRSKLSVVVENFTFLGGRGEAAGGGGGGARHDQAPREAERPRGASGPPQTQDHGPGPSDDYGPPEGDDIPF